VEYYGDLKVSIVTKVVEYEISSDIVLVCSSFMVERHSCRVIAKSCLGSSA